MKITGCFFLLLSVIVFNACNTKKAETPLEVGIAPYQDLAMIVNIKQLNLESKYGTKVSLRTMNWENILPAVASSGKALDVGFGSLIEYLTKENNLNKGVSDSLLFIFPAYVFNGGGFVTFRNDLVKLDSKSLQDCNAVRKFLSQKIGAQKNSVYDMMIFKLANRCGTDYTKVQLINTSLNDGILACENGSLDIASAGLTQLTQAQKEKGKVLLTMEDMGFADITGFICKKSTLMERGKDIRNLISMWFECTSYVMKDIDRNSKYSLAYLDKNAATKYSLESYKAALKQEYFPASLSEAHSQLIDSTGRYSYQNISNDVSKYLFDNKIVSAMPQIPHVVNLTTK